MEYIGKIDTEKFRGVSPCILTGDVVLTGERKAHIIAKHRDDYETYGSYMPGILEEPDLIIEDERSENTAFVVKRLRDTNLNIVLKIHVDVNNPERKNSVLTFYRLRSRNLLKLMQRNKVVYKRD